MTQEIKLKKTHGDTAKLLAWLGCKMVESIGQMPAEMVVAQWTIIRWYRRNMVRLTAREQPTLSFDPGEALAMAQMLNCLQVIDPYMHMVSAQIVNDILSRFPFAVQRTELA